MKLWTIVPLFLSAVLGCAQVTPEQADTMQYYHATQSVTLSGSATAFTLQLPAAAGKRVYGQAIIFECSADCTISQDRNGTAATGTAVTPVPLNTTATPAASFYQASNAGVGTALQPLTVKALVEQPIDMSYTVFSRGVASVQNHTWRVASMTGTVRATIVWGER